MGMAAILVMWPLTFGSIYSTQLKESPYEIWVQLAQLFLRKLCFDILMGLLYEWPWLKGQMSTSTFGIAS